MMAHLTNDPSFWVAFWALLGMLFTALATLLGLLIAWAKAKTAEIEARDAKAGLAVTEKSITRVEQAAGTMAAQVSTHSAQIAALQTQHAQGSPAVPPLPDSAAQMAAALVSAPMSAPVSAAVSAPVPAPAPAAADIAAQGAPPPSVP